LTGLVRDEKGQAMLLAMILLLISGLMAAPLLARMGTGLLTGKVYQTRTAELYAADAGVEDAVWKIQHQVDIPTGCSQDTTRSYNITDVNGKQVDYTITRANNETLAYQIVSTASGSGSATQIEAYVTGASKYGDFSGLLNYVISSPGDFYCPNPPNPCPCTKLDGLVSPGCGQPNGPNSTYTDPWPATGDLAPFYWQDVKNALPYYTSNQLDAKNYAATGIGPLYWNQTGDLNVVNTGAQDLVLKLNDTLYIRDSTRAIFTPSTDMTLDLNGKTIFVQSNITGGQYALEIGQKVSVKGPGAIIAVGDIYFHPKAQIGGEGNPIFILSASGKTLLQPGGDFYGAIAGGVEIDLKSNSQVYYPTGGFGGYGLNFPNGTQWITYSIASWEAKPL
jgi:hypothetical protein